MGYLGSMKKGGIFAPDREAIGRGLHGAIPKGRAVMGCPPRRLDPSRSEGDGPDVGGGKLVAGERGKAHSFPH